jgi:hypothetical protein
VKSQDVPTDLLNPERERKKKSRAAQSKQAAIEHGGKLEQARGSESAKRYAIRDTVPR